VTTWSSEWTLFTRWVPRSHDAFKISFHGHGVANAEEPVRHPDYENSRPSRSIMFSNMKTLVLLNCSCCLISALPQYQPSIAPANLSVSPPPSGDNSWYRPQSTESCVPNFTFDEMWRLQNEFWTQFVYPNNVQQAKAINSSLLAPNVSHCCPPFEAGWR
jgi:hypothetical protein